MYRGYKIRLYPTKEQEELFWKHIHACRFMWNYMIELQNDLYKNGQKYMPFFTMSKHLTLVRRETPWLSCISRKSLELVCKDVDMAFQRFFKLHANMPPKFRSKKKGKESFICDYDNTYFITHSLIVIPRCGHVRCKSSYYFPLGNHNLHPKNVRITYINGKWILSFAMECENQTLDNLNGSMGIDLGIKELAVVSHNGKTQVFHNINKSKKMKTLEQKKRYYQHRMDKMFMKNGKIKSKNRERYRIKFRKIWEKQTNIRNNYIHQIINTLLKERPKKVIMENLNISGMLKNKHLSQHILEQKFYMFIYTMKYKCEWAGIEFVLADRFYPSSKTCSNCGHIKKDLKLKDRTYICEKCGLEIDRDENAARNLEKYVA